MKLFVAWWAALGLGLLGQTTLLPHLISPAWRPDITLALVLWVALTGTPRGGAVLAFLSGLALDLVSGAPPGFSASQRLLVYALARPFRSVFFRDHPLLLLPFAALGAAADAVAAGALSHLAFPSPIAAGVLFSVAWRQALVASLWVPAVFLALEWAAGRQSRQRVSV